VAAVADRLAGVLDERGTVLSGLRQGRGEAPAQAAEGIRPVSPTPKKEAAVSTSRRREPARFSQTEVAADFVAALQGAGLRVSGPVAMDGVLRRAPVEGDRKGQKSGSYVGHHGGWPAGYIRNHKTGEEVRWKAARPARRMTAAERDALTAEAAVKAAERARERQAVQQRAARLAQRLWAAAEPATSHPYLAAKGVRSHGLRQDRRGRLLVPVHGVDGKLWGLQRVDVDGAKLFLKGARTEGGHMLIGGLPKPGVPLLVAEGYATGATLHEATGLSVAVAFNAANLTAVAQAYRAVDPVRPIVVAGDNDHHLPRRAVPLPNVGREKAEAAAAAVDGAAVVPSFKPGDRGSDWNDLARRDGYAPVGAAVRGAIERLQQTREAERVSMAALVAQREQRAQRIRPHGPHRG
jgi:phage/plasmid primase-like uncharacterized protein